MNLFFFLICSSENPGGTVIYQRKELPKFTRTKSRRSSINGSFDFLYCNCIISSSFRSRSRLVDEPNARAGVTNSQSLLNLSALFNI